MTGRARRRPAITDGTERAFQQGLTHNLCARYGWRWFHNSDSTRVRAGWPDLVLLGHGRALFLECKTATGRCTAEQLATLDDLAAAGNEVAVVRPADLPMLARVLGPRQERLPVWDRTAEAA